MTGGEVFYDGLDELVNIRNKLNYFPNHVWYYIIIVHLRKISEIMAFVGRTGFVEYINN
jgi:hypothetical protein